MIAERLAESEKMFRSIVENSHAGIFIIDDTFHLTYANSMLSKILGYPVEEIVGSDFRRFLDEPSKILVAERYVRRQKGEDLPSRYEFSFYRKDGALRTAELSSSVVTETNGKVITVGQLLDITERKQSEADLIKAREEVTRAAFEERARLARDFHDAVSQTLFSASIIADVLPRVWERDQAEGRKRLEEIRQLTRGALAEMRTLLLELRPAALVDAELGELLRQLGESITGRTRIPVKVQISGECAPPTEVKVGLYRIAQDALNNVAKHSGATRCIVSLHCEPDKIELVIRDNGRGFSLKKVSAGSLGLGIMHERAKSVDAYLNIESKSGRFTNVTVIWQNKHGRDSNA